MCSKRFFLMVLTFAIAAGPVWAEDGIPEDFPRFEVTGYDREMSALRSLYYLHYTPAGPLSTL